MAIKAIIVYEDDEIYPAVESMVESTAPKKSNKKGKGKKKEKEEEETEGGDDYDSMTLPQLKKAVRAEGYLKRITAKYSEDDLREMLRNGGPKEEEESEEEPKKKEKKGKAKKEEENEEETAVEVGMKVKFKVKNKEHSGKVKSIDYDSGKVKVKSKVDKKTYSVDPEKLSL